LDRPVSTCEGVYAFAINGIVVYVGVATSSFATRMVGYTKPGPTQSTNKRLKLNIIDALAHGNTVTVGFAVPNNFEWNGLLVIGSIGLECGLIRGFSLPWNKQGK
jgi:hypothetical protein